MTQSKWPADGAEFTEAQWSEMFDLVLSSGVFRGVTNELETYGDSSGMQVKTKTGKAWMKGHFYKNDAEVTLAIAANSSGNPRIDRVALRLNWADNTLVLAVLEGTPAGSPAAPALTQTTATWEISLAQVAVANGAATISAGNVTDERVYADGENTTIPNLSNSWAPFGDPYANPSYYKDPIGRVHLRGVAKSGTIGQKLFTLPAGYRPSTETIFATVANGAIATCEIQADGDVNAATGSNVWFSLDGISFRVE